MITAGLIPGRAEAIAYRLGSIANSIRGIIPDALKREAINLVVAVKLKLSDNVLHVRTGRLRRSITYKITQEGERFTAIVGTNVKYARIHEYGFEGDVSVKSFVMKEHQRMQSMAFGKMMKEPRRVTVKAHVVKQHSMRMHMPPRPFLRPSLDENSGRIMTNLKLAVAKAMKQ